MNRQMRAAAAEAAENLRSDARYHGIGSKQSETCSRGALMIDMLLASLPPINDAEPTVWR
jgi:hypothetical protein